MASEFVDTTLVDGFADGPHITEKQIGLANQGTYGPDDYVLETGRQAEAQILTNNSIRIFDAVYVIQGRRDVIAANDYTDVSIDNGAQGMNRNDIIVRRYEKDEGSEIESTSYAVIKGTPSSGTAADPDITEGDIRNGATLHEMKLYRVKLEGLNIVAVEPLFKVLMNMSTLNASLAELSDDIDKKEPTQKRVNFNNIYYKNGYNCFLHANADPASDVIINLSENYRPRSAAVVSGWCRNTSNNAYYPCVGVIGADGQWDYLSAMETIGTTSVYYIYNPSQSIDRRSRFQVWLTGAWSTSTNGS